MGELPVEAGPFVVLISSSFQFLGAQANARNRLGLRVLNACLFRAAIVLVAWLYSLEPWL